MRRSGPFGRARFAFRPGAVGFTTEAGFTLYGTAVHGQSLTLLGSGFGTKALSAPLWRDCESGAIGDAAGDTGDTAVWPNWRVTKAGTGPLTYPSFQNDVVRGGQCTKSIRHRFFRTDETNYQMNNVVSVYGMPQSRRWFSSFWRYADIPLTVDGHGTNAMWELGTFGGANNPLGERNWKQHNIYGSGGEAGLNSRTDNYPTQGAGHMYAKGTGQGPTLCPNKYYDIALLMTTGQWQRFDHLWDYGLPNQADTWEFWFNIDGGNRVTGAHTFDVVDPGTTVLVADEYVGEVHFIRYISQSITQPPPVYSLPAYSPATFWTDDFYMDTDQARLELGDAATWAACTHTEIQPWTGWASGEIAFTLNQGSFVSLSGKTLYAIGSDGSVRKVGTFN